jgi:hypothetical protein
MSKTNLPTVGAECLDERGSAVETEHVVGGVPKHRIDGGEAKDICVLALAPSAG